jgi:uncharacterized OsmC-like protein
MVEFPDEVKMSATSAYATWREAEGLEEGEKKSRFRRAVRVAARYLPQLRKELKSGDIVWYSDATKAVGGRGECPGALQHFLAGLPLCQMTHYAERASVWGIKLDDLEVSAVGHFTGLPGYGFDEIEYEVRIASSETRRRIQELALAAAGDCYVTNTLKRSSKVTGRVQLNGEELIR